MAHHQEIKGILAFIGAIWVVFLLEYIVPFSLTAFGVTPRTLMGLVGIPAMPVKAIAHAPRLTA